MAASREMESLPRPNINVLLPPDSSSAWSSSAVPLFAALLLSAADPSFPEPASSVQPLMDKTIMIKNVMNRNTCRFFKPVSPLHQNFLAKIAWFKMLFYDLAALSGCSLCYHLLGKMASCHLSVFGNTFVPRYFRPANIFGKWAARMKFTSARWIGRRGKVSCQDNALFFL